MLLEKERKLVVEYGQKLVTAKLTSGTGGNISIYNHELKLMAIKPSGMAYFDTKPEDVVVMDLDGNIVDGERRPSSESTMHSIIYKNRPDAASVIHCHSMYATTISCMNWDLPAVHYMIGLAGVNVRCAKYATYGSPELADNCLEAIKGRNAALLANHGLIACGADIASTFSTIEEIEFCSELYYRTKSMGEPVILSDEEMINVMGKFSTYGQNAQKTYKK